MTPPETDPPPHALPAETVLDRLGAGPGGLTSAEAAARLAQIGPNSLPEAPRPSALARLARQFGNVLIHVLLVAAAVTALLGHWVDTAVILAVVVGNAAIGFLQEGRAEQAMAAIRQMLALRAAVERDNHRQTVPAEDLVPGDIVLLEAGDRVPADIRLIAAHGLKVDEAVLTGESVPVVKDPAPVAADAVLGDRRSMVHAGATVAAGTGRGVVTSTGTGTEMGRIGSLLATTEPLTTPLLRQMDSFGRALSAVILGASVLLLGWGLWLGGRPFAELFLAVVGLAVAAIPEGLPAVMTITLAIGVQAMARRNAIVRRLPAIESIGSVSVICTDKTGTLTRNEMVVVAVDAPKGEFAIAGEGYAPSGAITPAGDLTRLARAAAVCNDATLHRRDGAWTVEGDPMEGALLAFAGKVDPTLAGQRGRRDVIPFDSRQRFMAVLDDAGTLYVKGAPERLLGMCGAVDGAVGFDAADWQARAETMAARGLRVLALASRPHAGDRIGDAGVGRGLDFLGLIGLIDPPRAEAVSAVADVLGAGITVKMITGDHAGTAAAVARAVGLTRRDRVLTGADLDDMDDDTLAAAAAECDVFARASPEHKLRLVAALQARGQSVAMTGDGVNDAPALQRADVGIAMGRKGCETAKEASDLVLSDDNFATIAAAVREGRTVFDNLRKVISFELPTSAGEALTLAAAILFGLALPITAVQVLWVNLITGVTLGLALAFEPTEPGTMRRPPRPVGTGLMTPALVWHVVLVSVLFMAAIFGTFAWATSRGLPVEVARTLAMNTAVVFEVFHLLFIRNLHRPAFTAAALRGTRVVWGTIAVIVAAQAAVTWLPLANAALGTASLAAPEVAVALLSGVGFFVLLTVEAAIRRAVRRG